MDVDCPEFYAQIPLPDRRNPETFRPYGVGYVELPCGLKVESRLRENSPDSLAIGLDMELELFQCAAMTRGPN